MKIDTKRLATLAMLSAVAYLVVAFGRIPLAAIGPLHLKFDPKDIVIVISGFIFGPLSSFLMSVVVSFVEMITVSEDGIIGLVMNVFATCAFACTASAIYRYKRTQGGAIAGLIIGSLTMTGVMMVWNYILTPIYMGWPREAVVSILVPVILPFNLIKSGLNAAFTVLLYKPLVTILRRSNLVPESEVKETKPFNIWSIIVFLFLLTTSILLILISRN